MKSFIILFIILSFASCTKNSAASENNDIIENKTDLEIDIDTELFSVESNNEAINQVERYFVKNTETGIWYDINITGRPIYEFMDIFQFTINSGNQIVSDLLRYFETTLDIETPMYEIDGDETSLIKYLPMQTEITILAVNNSRDDRHYLIKTKDDPNIWSGWIKSGFINDELNAQINNRSGGRFLWMTLEGRSTRNNVFAVQTGWMGEFIIVNNTGEIIGRIRQEEIIKIVSDAVDGGITGWSNDNTKIWFSCYMDSYTTNFGIIDIDKKMYMILECPPHFGSYQYRIDFDSGIIFYTDYRFQFDTESARQTKKSGATFHLYSYNFFTNELAIIDTNIGEGFTIDFSPEQGFTYKKTAYY